MTAVKLVLEKELKVLHLDMKAEREGQGLEWAKPTLGGTPPPIWLYLLILSNSSSTRD